MSHSTHDDRRTEHREVEQDRRQSAPRRHFTRADFAAHARLMSPTGSWAGQIRDVSLNGALMKVPENWPGDRIQNYILEFVLKGSHETIRMGVSVAHQEGEDVGLHREHMDDVSAERLKQLMAQFIDDPEDLERELEELENTHNT